MVSPFVIFWCDIGSNVFPALGSAFTPIFGSDDSDRSLLGDIVKHWLTILAEGTHIDQETVRRFYNEATLR
jgi:hypothetical protein